MALKFCLATDSVFVKSGAPSCMTSTAFLKEYGTSLWLLPASFCALCVNYGLDFMGGSMLVVSVVRCLGCLAHMFCTSGMYVLQKPCIGLFPWCPVSSVTRCCLILYIT